MQLFMRFVESAMHEDYRNAPKPLEVAAFAAQQIASTVAIGATSALEFLLGAIVAGVAKGFLRSGVWAKGSSGAAQIAHRSVSVE